MESPVGIVVAVKPPGVIIDVEVAAVCQRCASGKGCGAGLLGGHDGKRRVEVSLPNEHQLLPGDRVILEMSPSILLRAATLAYGLPLATMVLALMLGSAIAGPLDELTAVFLAATGLAGGIGISRWRLAGHCANNFMPEIRAIQPSEAMNREFGHE